MNLNPIQGTQNALSIQHLVMNPRNCHPRHPILGEGRINERLSNNLVSRVPELKTHQSDDGFTRESLDRRLSQTIFRGGDFHGVLGISIPTNSIYGSHKCATKLIDEIRRM